MNEWMKRMYGRKLFDHSTNNFNLMNKGNGYIY